MLKFLSLSDVKAFIIGLSDVFTDRDEREEPPPGSTGPTLEENPNPLVPFEQSVEAQRRQKDARREYRKQGLEQRIEERDRIAETFIIQTFQDYYEIVEEPDTKTESDLIGVENLMIEDRPEIKDLLEKLRDSAESYFDFKTDLFKFYHREDKGLDHFSTSPLSFADMEEENIEEKFPQDIKNRALMVALNIVIQRNQVKNIIKKRILQFIAVFLFLPVAVCWPYLSQHLPEGFVQMFGFLGSRELALIPASLIAFTATITLYYFTAKLVLKFILKMFTQLFIAANKNSFGVVLGVMSALNGKIRGSFAELLNDIESTQDDHSMIGRDDWPSKARTVFEVAMWEGKRIEYIERFWQIRFERLRIYELISDQIGNVTSRLLSTLMTVLMFGLTLWFFYPENSMDMVQIGVVTLMFGWVSWRLGKITRRRRYSFSLDDIISRGVDTLWTSFIDIKYYQTISEQYRNGKAAKQLELKRGLNR